MKIENNKEIKLKDICLKIRVDYEDMKCVELCEVLENGIRKMEDEDFPTNTHFTLRMIPELRMIEVDFGDFDLVDMSAEESKLKNNITVISSLMREELSERDRRDAVIHFAIEVFVENWIKYKIKEVKADYRDNKSYLEVPRGFKDADKYWDSLDGWDNESYLWKNNYDVTDELHKIGGIKDED